jgi:rubrerythrin
MTDELSDLLDSAIYKEIAAQAFYEAGQSKTEDAGAKELLKELAREEVGHTERLKKFKEKGLSTRMWHRGKVRDLKLSDYLVGANTLEGAGLQDVLISAIKREQQAIDFYSKMTGVLREQTAKHLCESLVHEELRHKLRLEILYDDLFYHED